MRPIIFLLGVVGLVLTGVLAVSWWRSHTAADPATVSLPKVEEAGTSRTYLEARGRLVVTLHDALTELPPAPGRRECGRWVEGVSAVGTPSQITRRAAAIPDPVLADLALTEFRALSRLLAACGTQEGLAAASSDVQFARTVFERRLVQLGVR